MRHAEQHKVKYCFLLLFAACNSADAVAPPTLNLIKNADFESGLSAWLSDIEGSVDWITDFEYSPPGAAGIGAAVIFTRSQNGDATTLYQCVGISAGVKYRLSAWALQECQSNAELKVAWYSDGTCSAKIGAFSEASAISDASTLSWQQLSISDTAPVASISAQISLGNLNECSYSSVVWDAVRFDDQIFDDSFE